MSDSAVAEALADMEAALAGEVPPTAESLAAWRVRFDEAVATATRGPEWGALVARAQALSGRVAQLSATLEARREEVRRELAHQAAGNRALKSYGATTL